MYAELILLDNLVMDFIVLKLAYSISGKKGSFVRVIIFSGIGAVYSLLAVIYPSLTALPFKFGMLFIFGGSMKGKSISQYLGNVLAVVISLALCGGISFILIFLGNVEQKDGIVFLNSGIRFILYGAGICATLPAAYRRLTALRIKKALHSEKKLTVVHDGNTFCFNTVTDSGNFLIEPVSSLAVIPVYAPLLKKYACVPIPYSNSSGKGIIYAFIPEKMLLGDNSVLALIAPTDSNPDMPALIPVSVANSFITLN